MINLMEKRELEIMFQMVKNSCRTMVLVGSLLTLPIFANAEVPLNNTVITQTNRQIPSDESLDKLVAVRYLKNL